MDKPRILIVDDEAHIRDALHRWFTLRGFDVDVAIDGQDAVEKCDRQEFDIITLDIEMPRMTGIEALPYLCQLHLSKPIIVLSGYIQNTHDQWRQSVVRVLRKPIQLHELEKAVFEALSNSSPKFAQA